MTKISSNRCVKSTLTVGHSLVKRALSLSSSYPNRNIKGKGNVDLYSTSSLTPLMRSGMEHTELPANDTISAFNRKHSSGGTTTHIHIANA